MSTDEQTEMLQAGAGRADSLESRDARAEDLGVRHSSAESAESAEGAGRPGAGGMMAEKLRDATVVTKERKDKELMTKELDIEESKTQMVTVDDLINDLGFGTYQRWLMVLCGAGWAADIMDIQAMSFLIPVLKKEWQESDSNLGLVAAFTFVGMLIGSLVWGFVSDRLGRKPAFMMTTLIAGSFGMLAAFSQNVGHLIACRTVQGFGLGGNLAVDFSLFMEYVPTESRGKLTTLMTIFATFGSLTAVGLAWWLIETEGWRVFLLVVSSPGLIIASARSHMLESPHFLATSGRMDECYEVLSKVAKQNGVKLRVDSPSEITLGNDGKMPFWKALSAMSRGVLRWRILFSSVHWFALSFGFYGVSVWQPSIFEKRGFEPQASSMAVFTSVACQLPGTLSAAYLVDRIGRRVVLIACSIGCCLFVSAFALARTPSLMLLANWFLNFSTAALWAVTYTFTPEIFPTWSRTSAMGICSFVARVSGILVSAIGGALLETSVDWSLGSYAVAYAVCAVTNMIIGVDMTRAPLSDVIGGDNLRLVTLDNLSNSL